MLFQRLDALPQAVVTGVGDFRLVVLVIEPVVALQLARKSLVQGLGFRLAEFFDGLL